MKDIEQEFLNEDLVREALLLLLGDAKKTLKDTFQV
ncbi:hypothetical protein VP496E541_P0099 [Vibrio phage 496E54-1]|nr:hypothetical protein VP495E541_P0098 [Vibrio phage 495E54-1]CAH9013514.1 hypothetical protein VP496E541_P0099 [Vibrio phage 496E54-1]